MSRTFLNQSTQIANSRDYNDRLTETGVDLEFSGSDSSIHDDLNALRTMTREVMGSTNWYDSPANTLAGLESGKLSLTGGTMLGTLNMSGSTISSVGFDMSASSVAIKGYVDDQIYLAHFRYSKEYASVITPTLSGTDLIVNPVYIAGVSTSSMHPTLDVDASLAVPFWYDFDTSTITSPVIPGIGNPGSPVPYMVTNFNLYANLHLNGQLLRYGPDFEFGSVAGALRFGFDLAMDDVICLVSDYYWGVPALGGGGGGGGGGGITIASISSFGGNTVITLNVDGVLIADPAAEGVTTSFTISYGGVALPVSAVGTPSTADITLSGTWSPEPIVGDVVGVEMSGGGGGGPGILTIDAFYYDSGVNRTQFTLKLDGVPWGGTVTAPAEFVINGAAPALPLAIQQVGAAQTTFNVIGQWPSVAVGDVVQHGPYNGTASTVSCINWVNESGVVVSKITLGIALSVGNTITFGSETLTITDINNSGFNGGSVEHGYVLSGLFIATPSGGDMVNFAIS